MKKRKPYAVKAVFFFLIFALFPLRSTQAAQEPYQGIHQQEYEQHQSLETFQKSTQEKPTAFHAASVPKVQKKVVGFHPYWMKGAYKNYRCDLLTTIAYFGVQISPQGDIVKTNGWPDNTLISLAHENGVKVVITVTNFNKKELNTLLGSEENRQAAIQNILILVEESSVEGVNIDFETMDKAQKKNLVTFIQDLSDTLHAFVPGSEVTIDIPAVDWSAAYDIKNLERYSDGVIIMGYDYHYKGSAEAGPVAPLQSGTIWKPYNVKNSVEKAIQQSDTGGQKILLGVPYYGYDWSVKNTSVPTTVTATGKAKRYSEIQKDLTQYSRQFDDHSVTPYYQYSGHQVWYEDDASLEKKYELIKEKNIGGIAIWALGYDDGYHQLWEKIEQEFTEGKTAALLVAPSSSSTPLLKLFDGQGSVVRSFYAYDQNNTGGFRVLSGDFIPDTEKQQEILSIPTEKFGSQIKIFNSFGTLLADETVYGKGFTGEISAATGDVNGDGQTDIVLVPRTKGGPNVRILTYDQSTQKLKTLTWFWAYEQEFRGGTQVVVKDLNNDGRAEIIVTPASGRKPEGKIYTFNIDNTIQLLTIFDTYEESFWSGVEAHVGNIDGDSSPDILITPMSSKSYVILFEYENGQMIRRMEFTPYSQKFSGGTNALFGKFENTTTDQLIIGPRSGGGPNIRMFRWNDQLQTLQLVNWFWAYQEKFRGGVNLQAIDTDGDQIEELITTPTGQGGPNTRIYQFQNQSSSFLLKKWFWAYESTFRGGVNIGKK